MSLGEKKYVLDTLPSGIGYSVVSHEFKVNESMIESKLDHSVQNGKSGNILSLLDVTDILANQDFAGMTGNSAHCYMVAWIGGEGNGNPLQCSCL